MSTFKKTNQNNAATETKKEERKKKSPFLSCLEMLLYFPLQQLMPLQEQKGMNKRYNKTFQHLNSYKTIFSPWRKMIQVS